MQIEIDLGSHFWQTRRKNGAKSQVGKVGGFEKNPTNRSQGKALVPIKGLTMYRERMIHKCISSVTSLRDVVILHLQYADEN